MTMHVPEAPQRRRKTEEGMTKVGAAGCGQDWAHSTLGRAILPYRSPHVPVIQAADGGDGR